MRLETFQMVDRILSLDAEGGRILARAVIPRRSPVFYVHFPGFEVVPGVLLIETMAQVAGHLAMAQLGFEKMVFLAHVREARFKRFVEPGDPLRVEATLIQQGSMYAVLEARLHRELAPEELTLAATAEIRFTIGPFPNDTMRRAILDEAARAGGGAPRDATEQRDV